MNCVPLLIINKFNFSVLKMSKYINRLWTLFVIIIIGLLVIFFKDGWITNWTQGLDLKGGVRLLYQIDYSEYEKSFEDPAEFEAQKDNVKGIVKRNIDNRISELGVSDYSARYLVLNDIEYIEVQIWWIDGVADAKERIWKTVEMTFKAPFEWELEWEDLNERKQLAEDILVIASWIEGGSIETAFLEVDKYTMPRYGERNISPLFENKAEDDMKSYLWLEGAINVATGTVYPSLVETDFSWDVISISNINTEELSGSTSTTYDIIGISIGKNPNWINIKGEAGLLNGERFKLATTGRSQTWEPVVNVQFDEKWSKIFCTATREYIKKPMAIFIGDEIVSAPTIQDEICGWSTQISGGFTLEEATKLKEDLNSGAMPVPLNLESEEKISPKLGETALNKALVAWGVGILLVFFVFLFMYGVKRAVITMFTLLGFFIILMASVKVLWVVLSLSAIGAVLLNIGMWVDANIIIFERIKEELAQGKSYVQSIMDGYTRSFSAIRDGNVTTGLIAFLLMLIGTNMFKGFGTMMIINIMIILTVLTPMVAWLTILFFRNEDEKKK